MNDDEQTARLKKQKYLNSEIIQKGYDAVKFKEFLETKKPGGGESIDVWNYFELVTLVKDFQFSTEKPPQQLDSPGLGGGVSNKQEKIETEKVEEDYSKTLTGREMGKTSFSGRTDVELVVPKFEIKAGGLFTSSYVTYEIVTKPFDWQVSRRFTDLFWLRKHLRRMFPGIMVPTLPNKRTLKDLSERNLTKNRYLVERFLNDTIRNPLLKNCRIMSDFLFINDESSFEYKKKDFNNSFKPERLEHHITLDGKQTLEINQPLQTYYEQVQLFLYEGDKIYQKIKKLNKKLLNEIDQISSTLFDLGSSFSSLYTLSNDFNCHISVNKNSLLENVYVALNNLMVDLGNSAVNQLKSVYENMCLFFKYEDKFNHSLKEILEERNGYYREFSKQKSKKTEKNSVFIEGSSSNNVFSIFQKDLDAGSIKDKFAFYNYQVSEELSRSLEDKAKRYIGHFTALAKKQSGAIYDAHAIWADVLTHFSEFSGENPPKKMSFDLKDTNKTLFIFEKPPSP